MATLVMMGCQKRTPVMDYDTITWSSDWKSVVLVIEQPEGDKRIQVYSIDEVLKRVSKYGWRLVTVSHQDKETIYHIEKDQSIPGDRWSFSYMTLEWKSASQRHD